jgi:hypothetical protein
VLVEALDWRDLEPKLAALEGIKSDVRQARSEPVQGRRLPAMRVAKATTPAKSVRMASAAYAPRGFVLDYVAVAGSGDYTFASGVTYYISSSGYFGGFVTFQPNCTIKFANNAYLVLYGEDIACLGTSGSYSVLTSKDDDLFGEPIPGSTATPTYAASQAIWIYYVSWSTTLSYLQIRWAKTGIQFDANPGVNPSHYVNGVKLQQSQTGIYANACAVSPSGTTKCGVTTPTTAVNGATFSGTITDDCAGDTDSDGLPDSWEVSNFGNITSQNGTGDPDGDGLTNLQEYQLGTNPNSANVDTDGDGLADGFDPNRTSANGPPTLSGQSLPKCPQ